MLFVLRLRTICPQIKGKKSPYSVSEASATYYEDNQRQVLTKKRQKLPKKNNIRKNKTIFIKKKTKTLYFVFYSTYKITVS